MGDSGGGVLQHLGLEQYSQLFESEEILDKLSEEQLSPICVRTMGQRMRLLSAAREAVIVSQVDEEGSEGEEEEVFFFFLARARPRSYLLQIQRSRQIQRSNCHLY